MEVVLRDIDELGAEAVSALRKFLQQAEVTAAEIARAKIAATAFSGWTRYKATESAREANVLTLARELAVNKDEFRKYVRIGMPNAPIVRALSE